MTSFIGREQEIRVVSDLLARDRVRLLTLTGPGGIGKTRLAIEVARRLNPYLDGAWFVPLAAISDPAMVGSAIAAVVGDATESGASAEQRIVARIHDATALLVLDNFEQVMGAAGLVTSLIEHCPGLTILVTSRSRLHLSAEQVYPVPPMATPLDPAGDDLDALRTTDAVQLFVERASSRRQGFTLTSGNAGAVAAICRQVDGLPLGIELAAALTSVLSAQEVLDRTGARPSLLNGGPADQPGRLRSLQESIAWSYDLLAADEQALFRRLGVFAGVWTLDAAEAVAGWGPLSVLDGVASLIDKNLVRQVACPTGSSHYLMLTTVREFAAGLLEASGEAAMARRRLAEWIATVTTDAAFGHFRPDGADLYARLDLHATDIVRSLSDVGDDDPALAVALASALTLTCMRVGGTDISVEPLARAVSRARETASPALGRGLTALAMIHHVRGSEADAWGLIEEALPLLAADPDQRYHFLALTVRGLIGQRHGHVREAAASQRRALDVLRAMPNLSWRPFAESTVLGHLGDNAIIQGDIATAKAYFDRALAIQVAEGFEPGTSHYAASHPIAGLGDVARAEGDQVGALARYREALRLASGTGDSLAAISALGGIAASLACAGAWERAARLFGADQALHELAGIPFGLETFDRQRALGLPEPWLGAGNGFGIGQHLRDAIWGDRSIPYPSIPEPERAAALWRAGRGLSLSAATAEALAGNPAGEPGPGGFAPVDHALSPREVEVVRLVTDGLTDTEIANALFISRRTAATHLRHIYDKIGVTSRAQAAAWAVRNGIA